MPFGGEARELSVLMLIVDWLLWYTRSISAKVDVVVTLQQS